VFASGRLLQAAFVRIPWGSPQVYIMTLNILRENNLRVHVLPQWHDIDVMNDLETFRSRHPDLPPGTSMTLDTIREYLRH